MTKALAPAKLILSGEHAVLYGQPAIATAINRYVECKVDNSHVPGIRLSIPQFPYEEHMAWEQLVNLEITLQHRYQQFTDNIITIDKVLSSPEELCWFAIIHLLSQAQQVDHSLGFNININTEIPLSRGLGSSAAIIVAIMTAINAHLQLALCEKTLFQSALATENLQHGYSSGIDVKIVQQGGAIVYQKQQMTPINFSELPFQLVDTGKAQSSTGESCQQVKKHFSESDIWQEFSACTNHLLNALKKNDFQQIKLAIKNNHQLLNKITVVPERVEKFIKEIEALGGVAKICGAGSVKGNAAGMVLISNDTDIKQLCNEFNYTQPIAINGIYHGTKII